LHRWAVALLHHPALVPRSPRPVVLARRRLAAGRPVHPTAVRRAFERLAGRAPRRWVDEPIAVGSGSDVETVVRHRVPGVAVRTVLDGPGRTRPLSLVRKTLAGPVPRELLAYRSGLLEGGEGYRPSRLLHAEADGADRWHLFLEDLGEVRPLQDPAELLLAARALGELNGRRLVPVGAAADLDAEHPWLAEVGRWTLPSFAELRRRAGVLSGRVPEDVRHRCTELLAALAGAEDELTRQVARLPLTTSHGDATRSNLAVRDGRLVLFDLTAVQLTPVGRDLADLVGLPNPALGREPGLAGDCHRAYRDALAAAGVRLGEDELGLAVRSRFVRKAFWWLLMTIPRRLPAGAGSEVPERRRQNILADLHRVAAEAELLLDALTASGAASGARLAGGGE
uniref:hypothetical protein n=1 Tax=Desertihabitans aurantiacus TaxID=2282477 RepID=UPI000DF7EADA